MLTRRMLLAGLAAVSAATAIRPVAPAAAPSMAKQLAAEYAWAARALIAALDARDFTGWTAETALDDTAPRLRLARALVVCREAAGQGDPDLAILAEQFQRIWDQLTRPEWWWPRPTWEAGPAGLSAGTAIPFEGGVGDG